MRNDYLLASSTVNTKPDVLYQAFPRDELPTFNQGRLERVIDMLNRAWDISPRLSIASFELALPHGGSDDPGGICQLMGQYFRTLSQLIQPRGPEYGQPTMGNSPTRLWGLWSGDTMAGRADSQIRVSCLLDSDACLMWQTPGLTWQSVLATTFQTAYRVVHGHRPEIPSLGVRLGADWQQSVDGYGDFAGFKAVFRQLSEHCRSHDRAFGCGLVPNRMVDLEFYPVDSFIFPPDTDFWEGKDAYSGGRAIAQETDQSSYPSLSSMAGFGRPPCPGLAGMRPGKGLPSIFCQTN